MAKSIVIAVDTAERTPDAIALGRVLAASTGAPTKLVTVFPHAPLVGEREQPELVRAREQAGEILSGLGREMGLEDAAVEVIAGNFAARELQHVTERADTGLMVVGSTTRGPIGRLLIGGVGERLLAGAASPVAIAPRAYRDAAPPRLTRIGVGADGSDEAQRALEAAVALARKSSAAISVITAVQPLAFGGVATTALPSTSANEAMRAQLRGFHENAVAAARESVDARSVFRDGSADQVLLEEAADLDLLVTGSRGYGPLGAVLMGSAT
ncbi:MAG: universal stress protein, partial [Chloroflexota bacterium]|nr:universal stress protein [Chloroflexota bacterium]